MAAVPHTFETKRSPLWATAHYVLIPLFGMLGAAAAVGVPLVDSSFASDTFVLQFAVLFLAFISSSIVAFVLRPLTSLKWTHIAKYLAIVGLALLASHLLWFDQVWGFHHDYALGIFAWLLVGGEDGFSITPNLATLPVTLLAYTSSLVLLRVLDCWPHGLWREDI